MGFDTILLVHYHGSLLHSVAFNAAAYFSKRHQARMVTPTSLVFGEQGGRFYRAPGTHAQGSGLDLSIVQPIIDLHQGTMRLGSPPSGVGLQVSIDLPRVRGVRI